MRFLDLCEKEVVSVEEGSYVGHVLDLEFDRCLWQNLCDYGARENIWEYFAGITNIVFHGLRL